MESAINLIVASLDLAYPGKPYEWVEKAATEILHFPGRYPNATVEQEAALMERVQNMCTTGQWGV